jgi:hypothetical protein
VSLYEPRATFHPEPGRLVYVVDDPFFEQPEESA